MCTLMQKDVLVEAVGGILALIDSQRKERKGFNEDEYLLIDLQNYLYATRYEKINFDDVVLKFQTIRYKYEINEVAA